jgi:hypothetical protein
MFSTNNLIPKQKRRGAFVLLTEYSSYIERGAGKEK